MSLKPVCNSFNDAVEFLSFCYYKVQVDYHSREEQKCIVSCNFVWFSAKMYGFLQKLFFKMPGMMFKSLFESSIKSGPVMIAGGIHCFINPFAFYRNKLKGFCHSCIF